jgi:hypothetical protein
MEMISFLQYIIDLRSLSGLSFNDEIFSPMLMMVFKDYNSLGIGFHILICQIGFGSFLMVPARGLSSQFLSQMLSPGQW